MTNLNSNFKVSSYLLFLLLLMGCNNQRPSEAPVAAQAAQNQGKPTRKNNCLNLKLIGKAASTIPNLEVRTDIIDIEGLDDVVEKGKLLKETLISAVREKIDPAINNHFFSFKEGITSKSFPKQSGCQPGSLVKIPESSHYAKFVILDATPDRLTLRSLSNSGILLMTRRGEHQLEFTAQFRLKSSELINVKEETEKSFNIPLKYTGVISWGETGSVQETKKSEHLIGLLNKYGIHE
jgi:hypothetical protein